LFAIVSLFKLYYGLRLSLSVAFVSPVLTPEQGVSFTSPRASIRVGESMLL